MPYMFISQDDSRQVQRMHIPHSIPPQTMRLVAYSISFHDGTEETGIDNLLKKDQHMNNPFNSVLYVRMPWVKNRDVVCARNESDNNPSFAAGYIPLLVHSKPNVLSVGTETLIVGDGTTFCPNVHGLNIELSEAMPSSFTCEVFCKNKNDQIVRFDGFFRKNSEEGFDFVF